MLPFKFSFPAKLYPAVKNQTEMSCRVNPCVAKRKEEKDLVLFCNVCSSTFHGKCVGLTGKTIDAINQNLGLKWSCSDCVAKEVEISNTLCQVHNGFKELKHDITSALSKLHTYERQFADFFTRFNSASRLRPSSDQFVSCPSTPIPESLQAESATLLSEAAAAVLNYETDGTSNNNTANVPLIIRSIDHSTVPAETINNAYNNLTEHLEESTAVPEGNNDENGLNSAQKASVTGNGDVNNATSSQYTSISTSKVAKFSIVPPNAKTIFASRFAADTTCKQISDFVCENLPDKPQVSVTKIKTNPGREKISFKITVPGEFFDKVVDPAFWPEHTFVREFTSSTSGTSRMNPGNRTSSRSQVTSKVVAKHSRLHSYNQRSQRQIHQGSSTQRNVSSGGISQSSNSILQSTDTLFQAQQSTMPMTHQQSTLNFVPQSTNFVSKYNQNFYNQQSTQIPYSTQPSSALPNSLQNYSSDRPVIQYIPANQSRSNNGSVAMGQNYTVHPPHGMPILAHNMNPNCTMIQHLPSNQTYTPAPNIRPAVAVPSVGGRYSHQNVASYSKNGDRFQRTVAIQ